MITSVSRLNHDTGAGIAFSWLRTYTRDATSGTTLAKERVVRGGTGRVR
jgi:hypothetical protein